MSRDNCRPVVMDSCRALFLGSLALLALSSCSATSASAQEAAEKQSISTPLSGSSCTEEVDREDPNETTYVVCPGVAGYALIVRQVDAGRESIEVVDPSGDVHPLNFEEVITREMYSLPSSAEWRVLTERDQQIPVALIFEIGERSLDDPGTISEDFLAVAKISPAGMCVTDRLVMSVTGDAELYRIADAARTSACAPPLPPIIVDGVVIR